MKIPPEQRPESHPASKEAGRASVIMQQAKPKGFAEECLQSRNPGGTAGIDPVPDGTGFLFIGG